MILEQIGVVRSPVDEGWGSVTSEVVIDEGYSRGLTGLDAFSHILVVFYMHRYTFARAAQHPSQKTGMQALRVQCSVRFSRYVPQL